MQRGVLTGKIKPLVSVPNSEWWKPRCEQHLVTPPETSVLLATTQFPDQPEGADVDRTLTSAPIPRSLASDATMNISPTLGSLRVAANIRNASRTQYSIGIAGGNQKSATEGTATTRSDSSPTASATSSKSSRKVRTSPSSKGCGHRIFVPILVTAPNERKKAFAADVVGGTSSWRVGYDVMHYHSADRRRLLIRHDWSWLVMHYHSADRRRLLIRHDCRFDPRQQVFYHYHNVLTPAGCHRKGTHDVNGPPQVWLRCDALPLR
ncbi:hypothetical protein T265_06104 [Opisthorchis viverrini]|uniref:Uncharacterized protein n=1 Tax=Opisthorchis viverrini TaxID=6198 RepID=A0A074ZLP9_OPIVI|nr:hypothetical protein T265_06104 [Opisthorchis viverrini]KER26667.1 hypothetical protein T265_06104 [Opisthorchis viverrini]